MLNISKFQMCFGKPIGLVIYVFPYEAQSGCFKGCNSKVINVHYQPRY